MRATITSKEMVNLAALFGLLLTTLSILWAAMSVYATSESLLCELKGARYKQEVQWTVVGGCVVYDGVVSMSMSEYEAMVPSSSRRTRHTARAPRRGT